jgi:homocysteine S-methyltransferase
VTGVTVLDGGLASELERRGASLEGGLWSARVLIDDPARISEVHEDYLRAGADIITTASYQASFPGLAKAGLSKMEATELLRLSVKLARDAKERLGSDARIAASIGPYGAFLADGSEYHGDYRVDRRTLEEFHRPKVGALLEIGGFDLLAFESVPSLEEAEEIVRVLQAEGAKNAWISFTAKDERSISHGESIEAAVEAAVSIPAVVAVGVNCTAPEILLALIDGARSKARGRPMLAYPNRGERFLGGAWVPRPGSFDLGAIAAASVAAGASIVGGCCRTGPEDIRAIRARFPRQASAPRP